MITLPAPQRSTVPMVLSARFEADLQPGGYFDFSLVPPQPLVNVSSGYLYRILSYSFATEIPEGDYAGALLPTFPMQWQLRADWNNTDILAKPVPLPMYQHDAKFLQYFTVTRDNTEVFARLGGRLNAMSVGLIGFQTVTAVLSMFVQTIADDEWTTKYDRGEM